MVLIFSDNKISRKIIMRNYKILIVLITVTFLFNSAFSQSSEKTFHKKDISGKHIYFTLNDSVKTTVFVYNNKAACQSVKIGLISGAIGYVVGLGAVYLAMKDHSYCDLGCAITYAVAPVFVGGVSFFAGTTIGYVIHYEERNTIINYSSAKRVFKQIGINSAMSLPVSDNYGIGKITFGISYRNLYPQKYIPNKLSLNYGYEALWYNYYDERQDFSDIWSDEWHVGLEAIHIDYQSFFSLLYGLELGVCFSESFKNVRQGDDYKNVPYKNVVSPYADLIIGINVNLFHFLSWDLTYRYEPYGIYNKLKPQDAKIISNTHKVATTLSLYFR